MLVRSTLRKSGLDSSFSLKGYNHPNIAMIFGKNHKNGKITLELDLTFYINFAFSPKLEDTAWC